MHEIEIEGWGGSVTGKLKLKINILGHLFLYIVQKRTVPLETVKKK